MTEEAWAGDAFRKIRAAADEQGAANTAATLSVAIGYMMNAQFALESGGSKREAIDILKRGIALARAGTKQECENHEKTPSENGGNPPITDNVKV